MKESPLSEVLKVLTPRNKKTKKTIRVCGCGTPMIWTFFFPGAERFCLNCGNVGGMLGTGDNVPATRELVFKKRLVDAIWKELYGKKGLIPRGRFGRSGCKKDGGWNSCNDHHAHLSKSEIEWNKIAEPYLEKFRGIFN